MITERGNSAYANIEAAAAQPGGFSVYVHDAATQALIAQTTTGSGGKFKLGGLPASHVLVSVQVGLHVRTMFGVQAVPRQLDVVVSSGTETYQSIAVLLTCARMPAALEEPTCSLDPRESLAYFVLQWDGSVAPNLDLVLTKTYEPLEQGGPERLCETWEGRTACGGAQWSQYSDAWTCAAPTCTLKVLDTDAGGYTCAARMKILETDSPVGQTRLAIQLDACERVAIEFENECGACMPTANTTEALVRTKAEVIKVASLAYGTPAPWGLYVRATPFPCAGIGMPSREALPGGARLVNCVGDCLTGRGYCYAAALPGAAGEEATNYCANCVLWNADQAKGEVLCSATASGLAQGGPLPSDSAWEANGCPRDIGNVSVLPPRALAQEWQRARAVVWAGFPNGAAGAILPSSSPPSQLITIDSRASSASPSRSHCFSAVDGQTAYQTIEANLGPGAIESPDYNTGTICHANLTHIRSRRTSTWPARVFDFQLHYAEDCEPVKNKKDRQRNEIKVYSKSDDDLKGYYGSTMIYSWSFRMHPDMKLTRKFTHLFQLKFVGGDSQAPAVTFTGAITGYFSKQRILFQVRNTSHSGMRENKLATAPWSQFAGHWINATVEATMLPIDKGGRLKASLTQADTGATIITVDEAAGLWRDGNEFIRPKWGIYRQAKHPLITEEEAPNDAQMYMADFCIRRRPPPPPPSAHVTATLMCISQATGKAYPLGWALTDLVSYMDLRAAPSCERVVALAGTATN